jgi:hypothetical protein
MRAYVCVCVCLCESCVCLVYVSSHIGARSQQSVHVSHMHINAHTPLAMPVSTMRCHSNSGSTKDPAGPPPFGGGDMDAPLSCWVGAGCCCGCERLRYMLTGGLAPVLCMYVYLYIYMCVCVYIYIYICLRSTVLSQRQYRHTYVHARIHTCVRAYAHTHSYPQQTGTNRHASQ